MAGAFRKEVVRSITHSLGRFLAIAIIAALGCGFYAGLRLTGPDMRLAGDTYYDATNLCDLRVVSSLGFTDDQIDEISQVEGVSGVMPAYESDVIAQIDGVQYTTRIHSLNVDKARASECDDGLNVESSDPNYINRPILVEGSWPESNDECLLSADTVWSTEVSVGDKVLLAEGTSDLDDTFAVHEYTVSGFVRSSYYTCSTSVGSTSLGSGQLATFAYVPEGAFAEDFPYTEAFVTVAGAREVQWATDDYQSLVDATASRINGISNDLLASRLDGIRADAQAELDESRVDFEAERADALQKLDDAQAELDDAKAKLDDAAAKLASSQATLDSSARDLASGQAQVDSGRAELEAQRAAAEEQFAAAEAQLDAAQASYDAAMAQRAQLVEQLAQAQAAGAHDIAAQLEAAIAQIDAQTAGVPEQIAQGRAQLAEQRSQAQASMDAAEGELASSQATIDSGRAQLESGRRQLASGRSEYEDGLAQYEEGANELSAQRADAEEQFADAEAKLADAQADVDAIADTEGEVYVLDLTKNIGAESFKSDAGRIDQIAQVFPFLFFLVAALVSLTTMTRMVEEERVLIGTFKALGYSKARITSKYLIYAIVASGVGAIVGIVALSKFLPWFIMGAYAIIYAVPCRPCPIDPAMTAAAAGLGVGITVIATWFAAASTLRERPAFLMLPRAPKAGKRILLERIRPVWRRLSFSWKVTSRNLFRYKRRFIMAIVGIAGCTALLLTGLGLQNAINDIIDKQYGELYHYNTIVRMASDSTDDEKSQVEQRVEEDASGEYAWLATANKQAQSISDDEGADVSQHRVDIVVPEYPDAFSDFNTLRTREGHEELALSDDGVLVSEKLAMELSLEVGSTFSIFDEDAVGDATGDGREVTVAGIMENYVGHYVYFTPTLYEQVMGEEPVFATLYANEVEDEGAREVLSDELLATDGVKTVTYNDETIDSYRTMLKSVDSVVVVLVIAAALLAFVVLYNLTNINITERVREIATLKVLGFTPREVDAYIYRETLLLAVIGALVGLLLGIVMEGFVVVTAEVDQVMFGRDIHAASFIIAFLLTMVFSVIVTLAMRPKLRRIDMVESLKSNE